jgi:uncharacterized membrane protein YvbJ
MPRVKCPNCGAQAPEGAPECPGCGVLFSKLKALKEREKREAAEFLALSEKPLPSASSLWRGRAAAAAVVMLWLIGLFAYLIADINRRAEKKLPPGTIVPVRR